METQSEATRVEKILIMSHKSNDPDYGYNVQCGTLAQSPLHSTPSTDGSAQTKVDGRGKAHAQQVNQYSKYGDLIATYSSLKDASTLTGINHGDICSCCQGHKADGTPKYTAGGFIWKYVDAEKEVG